jgi:hypothetical protein
VGDHHQRGEGDQQNIGEGNAQQLGSQRKFIGGISKPGGGSKQGEDATRVFVSYVSGLLTLALAIVTVIGMLAVSNPETYETNTRVASSPCLLLYSARIGTNA